MIRLQAVLMCMSTSLSIHCYDWDKKKKRKPVDNKTILMKMCICLWPVSGRQMERQEKLQRWLYDLRPHTDCSPAQLSHGQTCGQNNHIMCLCVYFTQWAFHLTLYNVQCILYNLFICPGSRPVISLYLCEDLSNCKPLLLLSFVFVCSSCFLICQDI